MRYPRTLVALSLVQTLAACAGPQDEAEANAASVVLSGAPLDVPREFPTLQAALAAARPGETVELAAGDYAAGAVTLPAGVTVRGAGATTTTVRGAFTVGGAGARLADLALVGANAGTGIAGAAGGLVVERARIQGFQRAIAVTGDITVRGSTLAGNGWGVEARDGRLAVHSSVVAHNTQAGIVTRGNVVADVLHVTVVGNGFAGRLEDGAGGITLGSGGGRVMNNVVVGNRQGIACHQCGAEFGHDDVWGNPANYAGEAGRAPGDLSVDPGFVDPAGQDFRLTARSPCIDAGVDLGLATDADGRPRRSWVAPDLGAYELQRVLTGLVLNEVMANPLDEATGEYVEIYNAMQEPVDLAGFVLDDGDAPDVLRGQGGSPTVLAPGGYAVVLDPDYAGQYALPAGTLRLSVADRTLGNGLALGDPLRLLSPDGTTVASTFSRPFDPGNGVSAERTAPLAPDEPASWVPSPCGASPGAVNCAAAPPAPEPLRRSLSINEVMANPLDEDTGEFVELLNDGEVPIDAKDLVFSDGDARDVLRAFGDGSTVVPPGGLALVLDPEYAGEYPIPAGVVLLRPADTTLGSGLATDDALELRAPDGEEVLSTFRFPSNPGNGVSIERVTDRGDVAGNWIASPCPARSSPGRPNCATPAPPAPPELPRLALTEVMANPRNESTGEFVEVHNRGEAPVDLAGLFLFDGDAADRLVAHRGGPTLLPPGGYAVVVDPDYDGAYAIAEGAIRLTVADRALGSGLSTGDAIHLLMPDQSTAIDRWLEPFDPGDGRSAERVDREDGSVAWVPAACEGAQRSSPGRANCADGPAPPPPPPERLPDILTNADLIASSAYVDEREFPEGSCAIVEGCVGGPGLRKLLRFSIETANIGDADLVMGNPAQRPELFEFSPCHGHYHFNDYARYSLRDAVGNVVAPGHKQSFCLLDSRRVQDGPDIPQFGQYGCGNQGISRGWADIYAAGLDCQWIDITGVAPGTYSMRIEVNFNQVLRESNYENNVIEVPFTVVNDDITTPCEAGAVRGTNAECGWTPTAVVACNPGERVDIGCTGAAECGGLGACEGNPALRVCAGDGIACHADRALAAGDDACGTNCPHTQVVCPPGGALTLYTSAADGAAFRCELGIHAAPPPPPTEACPAPAVGISRDCGWQVAVDPEGPVRARACVPGSRYVVGCSPAPAACGAGVGTTCAGDPMLRICAGDTECRDAAALARNDDVCAGRLCAEATFVCPAEGAFTVLSASYGGNAYECGVAIAPAQSSDN